MSGKASLHADEDNLYGADDIAEGYVSEETDGGDITSFDVEKLRANLLPSPDALNTQQVFLHFKNKQLEAEYLIDVARRRSFVLGFIFVFDVVCFFLRFSMKILYKPGTSVRRDFLPQGINMIMLYAVLTVINRRSRTSGSAAAQQEELFLSGIMTLAITNLLNGLTAKNPQDYVLMCFFLICTSTFMQMRWWLGSLFLALPTGLMWHWYHKGVLPITSFDPVTHVLVAWAVGTLMAFLAETYRRQMFANHKLAADAAARELLEAQARIRAQQDLARAEAEASHRALMVAREKAANDAKSEFMSLMCHEVRTPLNGCLASAEMLLETPLREDQRELANTIRVSGSILLSTVSNFLDFFKLEAGKKLDIVRTEVPLRTLVNDVLIIIDAMIGRNRGVTIRRPDLRHLPPVVLGDPYRLKGVLLNLMTNAAKFTKTGSITLRVSILPEGQVPSAPPAQACQPSPPEADPRAPVRITLPEDSMGPRMDRMDDDRTGRDEEDSQPGSAPSRCELDRPARHSYVCEDLGASPGKGKTERPTWEEGIREKAAHKGSRLDEDSGLSGYEDSDGMDRGAAELRNRRKRRSVSLNELSLTQGERERESTRRSPSHRAPSHALGYFGATAVGKPSIDGHSLRERLHQRAALLGMSFDPPRASHPNLAPIGGGSSNEMSRDVSHINLTPLPSAHRRSSNASVSVSSPDSFANAPPRMSDTNGFGGPGRMHMPEDGGPPQRRAFNPRASEDNYLVHSQQLHLKEPRRPQHHLPQHPEDTRGWFKAAAVHSRRGRSVEIPGPSAASGPDDHYRGPYSPLGKSRQASDLHHDAHGLRSSSSWMAQTFHRLSEEVSRTSFNLFSRGLVPGVRITPPLIREDREYIEGGTGTWVAFDRTDSTAEEQTQAPSTRAGQANGPSLSRLDRHGDADGKATPVGGGEWTPASTDSGSLKGSGAAARFPASLGRSLPRASHESGASRPTRESIEISLTGVPDFQRPSAPRRACDPPATPLYWLTFEVEDTGVGIPPGGLEHLFKEYVQGSEEEMRKPRTQGGTGLGLAICSKQVHFLGGRIGANSELGQGSTFWFQVPLALPPAAAQAFDFEAMLQGIKADQARHAQTAGRSVVHMNATPALAPLSGSRGDLVSSPASVALSWPHPNGAAAAARTPDLTFSRGGSGLGGSGRWDLGNDLALSPASDSQPGTGTASVAHALQLNGGGSGRGGAPNANGAPARSGASLPIAVTNRAAANGAPGAVYSAPVNALAASVSSSSLYVSETAPTVPRTSLTAAAAAGPAPAPAAPVSSIRPEYAAKLRGVRVLLAEDNLINQKVACKLVQSMGMVCEVAMDGREAVARVREVQEEAAREGSGVDMFDLVLMDMSMPNMGGVEATKILRKNGVTAPIVAMTANASQRDRLACQDAGMSGFLSKPVLRNQLAEAIIAALEGRGWELEHEFG